MPARLSLPRQRWRRKPFVQVVPNKKALEKKYACRKSRRAYSSPEETARAEEVKDNGQRP